MRVFLLTLTFLIIGFGFVYAETTCQLPCEGGEIVKVDLKAGETGVEVTLSSGEIYSFEGESYSTGLALISAIGHRLEVEETKTLNESKSHLLSFSLSAVDPFESIPSGSVLSPD